MRSLRRSTDAPPLLRKLRLKFIAVNMGLAALVLTIAFTTICFIEHRSDTDEVYRALTQAAEHAMAQPQLIPNQGPLVAGGESEGSEQLPADGAPAPDFGRTIGGTENSPVPEDAEGDGQHNDGFAPPQIGGPHGGGTSLPIAVYYCEGGVVMQFADQSSAAVSESVLKTALNFLRTAEKPYGYLAEEGLFYAVKPAGPGIVVAFADGAAADAWQSLAWALVGVGAGALALLFAMNLLFSRWALGPVQRAWTQQQQFIADASHELKTPLTVILANNAILRQRGDETIASQGQWIESTQMEAERMQALVTDMLDLARPTTANAEKAPAPSLDFSRLVEGEALTFESVAFEGGLIWETEVTPDISVRGDARRLQRLVAVLLDNACKYTGLGGAVRVRLRTEERTAVLTVNNTGEPIAPEDLPHLFDRFYRADKARTHGERAGGQTSDGYGLGLAIAQDIAHAHKGTLTAASTAEAGTTFTLKLPLA